MTEAVIREAEHRCPGEHSGLLRRLALNIRLSYAARLTGATRVPRGLLRERQPSTPRDDLFTAFYLPAHVPILVAEGLYCVFKGLLASE